MHDNKCPRCGGWKEELERLCADCEFDEQLEAVEGHEKVEKEEEEAGISFPASEKLR